MDIERFNTGVVNIPLSKIADEMSKCSEVKHALGELLGAKYVDELPTFCFIRDVIIAELNDTLKCPLECNLFDVYPKNRGDILIGGYLPTGTHTTELFKTVNEIEHLYSTIKDYEPILYTAQIGDEEPIGYNNPEPQVTHELNNEFMGLRESLIENRLADVNPKLFDKLASVYMHEDLNVCLDVFYAWCEELFKGCSEEEHNITVTNIKEVILTDARIAGYLSDIDKMSVSAFDVWDINVEARDVEVTYRGDFRILSYNVRRRDVSAYDTFRIINGELM